MVFFCLRAVGFFACGGGFFLDLIGGSRFGWLSVCLRRWPFLVFLLVY
jgi:hypothetical protein